MFTAQTDFVSKATAKHLSGITERSSLQSSSSFPVPTFSSNLVPETCNHTKEEISDITWGHGFRVPSVFSGVIIHRN